MRIFLSKWVNNSPILTKDYSHFEKKYYNVNVMSKSGPLLEGTPDMVRFGGVP